MKEIDWNFDDEEIQSKELPNKLIDLISILGRKVAINPDCSIYPISKHVNDVGKIEGVSDNKYPVTVIWSNGSKASYFTEELILII